MQTIKITITSEKPANVVITERKPEDTKGRRKKKIEDLLKQMPGKEVQK